MVPVSREQGGQTLIACCGLRPKATSARENKWSERGMFNFHGYVGHISSFSRFHGYGSMQIKKSFDSRGRKD